MHDNKNSRDYKMGILTNHAGKGHYTNEDALRKLIRYIARSEGSSKAGKEDVLCTGAYGAVDFLGEAFAIRQFEDIQHCYRRAGKISRYADHEIFSFSPNAGRKLKENPEILPALADKMAAVLSDGQYQVFYGIHTETGTDTSSSPDTQKCQPQNLHIHFAVNTVNFQTLNKRQETITATRDHERQLQELVRKNIWGSPDGAAP